MESPAANPVTPDPARRQDAPETVPAKPWTGGPNALDDRHELNLLLLIFATGSALGVFLVAALVNLFARDLRIAIYALIGYWILLAAALAIAWGMEEWNFLKYAAIFLGLTGYFLTAITLGRLARRRDERREEAAKATREN